VRIESVQHDLVNARAYPSLIVVNEGTPKKNACHSIVFN
jgi:hypothetical protein